MELFKLFGTIAIKNKEANDAIDETTGKAQESGSKFEQVGSKLQSVGGAITNVGTKLMPVSIALAGAGAASTKMASDFSDGMLKVQSLSGATGDELVQLSNLAKELGSSTSWSAKDVADAMGYMALAGFDAGQIMESTGGMLSLASASGEQLSTVTDILTDSMTAFGDGAKDAGRYADVLATTQAKSNTTVGLLGEAFKYVAPLAGAYGYKLEDVSTALGMMANAGVKGSMAGTSLSSVITRLGTNTDGCRDVIEEMGISFYNSDGTARNLSDVLKDLCDATQDLTVEQKSELAKTIAGQEAQKGLLAILNQGSDAYADLESKIKNCNGSASEMANNLESGLGGSLRSMKSALEGASISLGEVLAPIVVQFADKIKDLCSWFSGLNDGQKKLLVTIGIAIAVLAPALIIIGQVISSIGTIMTIIPKVRRVIQLLNITLMENPIILIIAGIVALVVAFIYLWNHCEAFRNFWIGLWNGIKTVFETVWNVIVVIIQTAIQVIKVIIEVAVSILLMPWMLLWSLFGDELTNAWNKFKEIITNVLNVIKSIIQTVWNGIKAFLTPILNGIKTVFTTVFNAIKTVVSTVMNALKTVISVPMNAIKTTVSAILNGIKNLFTSIFNGIKTHVSGVVNWLKGIFNFNWSLPKIKLPHFSKSGSFSLNPPSVPSFSIKWYKKAMEEPYMFTKPTVFGLKGAGEAGDEMMYGRSNLMNDIGHVVANQNMGVIEKLDRIITLLVQFFPSALEAMNRDIVLDTGVMAGQLAPSMNRELGRIAAQKGRGR